MPTIIRGLYRNGLVKPLKKVNTKDNTEVIILFPNKKKNNHCDFMSAIGSWSDLDAESLKKHIYKNRKISGRKTVIL